MAAGSRKYRLRLSAAIVVAVTVIAAVINTIASVIFVIFVAVVVIPHHKNFPILYFVHPVSDAATRPISIADAIGKNKIKHEIGPIDAQK